MKWFTTCFALLAATGLTQAQELPYPIVDFYVQDTETPGYSAFANLTYSVNLYFNDTLGTTVYGESHTGTLDATSHTAIQVGSGTIDPDIGVLYKHMQWAGVSFMGYDLTVNHPNGNRTVQGEYPISRAPHSIIADCALNAKRIADYEWSSEAAETGVVFAPPSDVTFCIPVIRKDPLLEFAGIVQHIPASSIVRPAVAPSAVDDTPVNYQIVGRGEAWPWSFGSEGELVEIENAYQVSYNGPMDKLYNLFGVKMKDYGTNLGRPAAAIYAENIYDNQGVGMFSNGRSRGIYAQGQTGAIGVCNNQAGNGAALWGHVGFAAQTGNANYAGYFNSNGLANCLAARFDGDVNVNGDLTEISDSRLKTDIRTSALGLAAILQLRPTTYEYVQEAVMPLPQGPHHGFIAQELEAVIPDMVKEIPFPVTTDPEKFSSSATVTYKAIDYIELIPVLTKAIQELNAKVDAQAAEIAALKKQIAVNKDK